MMNGTGSTCRLEERRRKLFGNSDWNGMDFVEVADDQRSLCVHFFGEVPEGLRVKNVRIEGGRRIRDIEVLAVRVDRAHDPELDDCLQITLDKFGDFSTYRLCLVESEAVGNESREVIEHVAQRALSGLDPRYACLDFSFKVGCPSDLDCKREQACPAKPLPAPEINYLAKDYASFRQLMLDRLAVTLPEWQERHVPDIGIALVELLAYAGDHLSYYQDAVATEAYLDTARQRISLRRHARLVDYRMHEGSNARAWVSVWTKTDLPPMKPTDFYFITGFPSIPAESGGIVRAADLEQVPRESYAVFEPLVREPAQELTFLAAHSRIRFYTWGDNECCLARGSIRATLLDQAESSEEGVTAQRPLQLRPGEVLIFEEVLGPTTGTAADADPAKRHAVRLTKVTPAYDGLLQQAVVEIEWAYDDALPFSLCLSTRLPAPACTWIYDVSVARGNVLLVDHGRTLSETLGPVAATKTLDECACEGSIVSSTTVPERFRPTLQAAPITFSEPLSVAASANETLTQDVRKALPVLTLGEYQVGDEARASGPNWTSHYDLLASTADDRHFVLETDDDGRGHLRFGDGELGRQPSAATRFQAAYRVGSGPTGNVGRDTIDYLVLRTGTLSADSVKPRNPLAARGGSRPEASAEVKLFAAQAVRNRRLRAIIAEDYAELARHSAKLQRAACELRWMGSWYEARVAVDPRNTERASVALLSEVERDLFKYRRIGHDLALVPARYVPLALALEICVLPSFTRGHVKAELLALFGNRRFKDGQLGFFHPENLSFGEGIYLSQIVARAQAVEGVETVRVKRLERLHEPDGGALDSGVLRFAANELAQLDSDPNFPENGRLELLLRGGR